MEKLFSIVDRVRVRGFAYLAFLCVFLFLACNHENNKGENPEKILLSPPSGITAIATENAGELEVKWKSVQNNNGYKIFYKTSGYEKTLDVAKDVTTAILKDLQGGREYSIQLKTKGDGSKYSDSLLSLVVKVTAKDSKMKLKTPSSFTVKATGEIGEVECSWEAVQHASSYIISYKKTATQDVVQTQEVQNDKVQSTISALENNVEYSFSIMARGDGSVYFDSDVSQEVKATPNNQLLPPKNIKAFPLNKEGAIFLKWNNVSHNNGYVIKYKEGSNEQTVNVAKDEFSGTLQSLQGGTEYSISIQTKAESSYTDSNFSPIIKCTTIKNTDVLNLKKIEIAGQEELVSTVFSEIGIEGDGVVVNKNPNNITFAPTTSEVEIKPTFEGSTPKTWFIISGIEPNKKQLEGNKIQFVKDQFYHFELVAQTNTGRLIKWVFSGRAVETKIDLKALYIKGDCEGSSIPQDDVLEGIAENTTYLLNPALRNEKELTLNVKKNTSLISQNFLIMLSISDESNIEKVEFDSSVVQSKMVGGSPYYVKMLTPDGTGKVLLKVKFTLKNASIEERTYTLTLSDKGVSTDIDKVVLGTKEFDVVALPSTYLTVFVPEEYKGKNYPVSLKFTNGATYNLYFWDDTLNEGDGDWKKVNAGDSLDISGEKDGFMVDIIPEIGRGLYDWNENQIMIMAGLKDAPTIDAVQDITMGEDNPISIKGATSQANAVEVAAKDVRSIVITFDADNSFNDNIGFYTAKEYAKFLSLSQKDKLSAELEEPAADDLKETEATEFVLILTREIAEGYKDVVYHVWLKKKAG